jgi:hypothetical protein
MTSPLSAALARKWVLQVDTTPESLTASWVQVKGLAGFTPKLDSTLQDDSDYDSGGWGSQAKTAMAWSLEVKLVRKYAFGDPSSYDVGQEVIRAAADAFGSDATVHVRWYDREGGPEAYVGYAQVTWSPDGGKTDDLETVTATLTGQGARTPTVNPAA